MIWEFTDGRPVYIQLVDEIKLRITSGIYKCGERMPSVRDLAQEAKVNPNTMQKALQELEREGLIFTNRTSGKFVTEDADEIKQVRRILAQSHVAEFLTRMRKMGFTDSELIDELKNYDERGISDE